MNKKSKIIGIDLDDVLLNFYAPFIEYHNMKHGTNLTRDHITSFYLEDIIGGTREEMTKKIYEFYFSEQHENSLPVEGAQEAIKYLAEQYTLVIVTAKPEDVKEKTLLWLERHYPNTFDQVYFTGQHHGNGKKKSKVEICKEIGIEIFIDDHIDNAKNISKEGIPVLLLDAPWNQEEVPYPIVRVRTWKEIVDQINM